MELNGVTKTRLQLRFRIWGPNLDPSALTNMTAVQPTKSFRVGKRSGRAAHAVAGWEWWSDWGESDVEPLMAETPRVLQLHEANIQAAARDGASVSLTVVGEVSADLISTEAEASTIGWDNGEGDAFRPFLVTDRPVIFLDRTELAFLVATQCTVETHLDFDLEEQGE